MSRFVLMKARNRITGYTDRGVTVTRGITVGDYCMPGAGYRSRTASGQGR